MVQFNLPKKKKPISSYSEAPHTLIREPSFLSRVAIIIKGNIENIFSSTESTAAVI